MRNLERACLVHPRPDLFSSYPPLAVAFTLVHTTQLCLFSELSQKKEKREPCALFKTLVSTVSHRHLTISPRDVLAGHVAIPKYTENSVMREKRRVLDG